MKFVRLKQVKTENYKTKTISSYRCSHEKENISCTAFLMVTKYKYSNIIETKYCIRHSHPVSSLDHNYLKNKSNFLLCKDCKQSQPQR